MDDGYLIVFVDDFQIIYSHFSSRSPIQRLLFAYITYVGHEPEIVGEELSEFAGIFIGKTFLPCLDHFGN